MNCVRLWWISGLVLSLASLARGDERLERLKREALERPHRSRASRTTTRSSKARLDTAKATTRDRPRRRSGRQTPSTAPPDPARGRR